MNTKEQKKEQIIANYVLEQREKNKKDFSEGISMGLKMVYRAFLFVGSFYAAIMFSLVHLISPNSFTVFMLFWVIVILILNAYQLVSWAKEMKK